MVETRLDPNSTEALNADVAVRAAYQRLVDSSPDGIFAFDRDLICTVWNPGMSRLTRLAEQEALGEAIMRSLYALRYDDRASLIEVLLDNTVILEDLSYPLPDGKVGYLAGYLSPLRDEHADIIGGLGVLRDVTESKHIARALNERLRETLLLNRVIAAAFSTLDMQSALRHILAELAQALDIPQGAIALLNERQDELTIVADLPRENPSVIGARIPIENNPATLYVLEQRKPLAISHVPTDDRLGVVRSVVAQRGITSMLLVPLLVRDKIIGTLGLDSHNPREFTDDEIALVQHVAAAASQAMDNARLYNDLELERAYLLLANDAGHALAAQVSMKGVLHAALSLAPRLGAMDGYVLVLDDGIPLYFESTYPPTLDWSDDRRHAFALHLAESGLEKVALETRRAVIVDDTRSDPRWYHLQQDENTASVGSVIAVPFFGTRSTLTGVVGYHHDMPQRFDARAARVIELIGRYLAIALENARLFEQTQAALADRERAENERLALERKMLEAQKLESLGLLAGGIAHDFNNLLVTMLGNAGLALTDVPRGSRAQQHIEQIQIAAQRAADLTHQMLAYSGKGRFVVQPSNLNHVIDEMVKLLRVSISKQATLQLNLAPNLPLISADPTQLRQVVMNLITNASDALADQAGTITVSTGAMYATRAELERAHPTENLREGEYVFLEVADTGSGMDSETRARIFEPFFTTKFTGRGLGLAAVLGIMRGHHGTIQVDSVPGKGTRFRLLFPPQEISGSAPALLATDAQVMSHAKLLVVDDEAMVRQITIEMLRYYGYETLGAENGQRAVELAREHAFDCVLLDLTMPGLSSEETLRRMREITPNLRVILISGYTEQDATARFGIIPPDGFIQKPFTPKQLQDRVHQALNAPAARQV